MGAQGIRSLVAAVFSVLVVVFFVSLGAQPGDRIAVPMAPIAQPLHAEALGRLAPELSEMPATVSDDVQLLSGGAASMLTVEEPPWEDTTVLTTASSVPTTAIPAAVPAIKPGTGTLLSMPVEGRKTSRFGMRFHPIRHINKLHSGLDIAAPCGTPVGAAASGTVVRTGWAGGNGTQVKLDHGTIGGHRVVTTYNHLSAIGVSVGQTVTAHQGVGRVGTTGFSTGCHLHFEVIADGNFTNPEPWLDGSPAVVDSAALGQGQLGKVPQAARLETPRATASPSMTPVPSITPGVTASPSPSLLPTPSPVLIASPSPSPSPSSSPSPSPTTSPSPSATQSPSLSPSSTDSLDPQPSAGATPDLATPTPTGAPDPSQTSPEAQQPGVDVVGVTTASWLHD